MKSQFPVRLRKEYWEEVRRVLVEEYGKTKQFAILSVKKLRKEYKEANIGDIVYHDSPEHVAECLSKWKREDCNG